MKTYLAATTFLFLFAACGDHDDGGHEHDENLPSCEEDDRDDTFVAGLAKTGSAGYTVALMDSNPSPPAKGDNTWSIEVTDPGGTSMPGLAMGVRPFMPDHGHGTPAEATVSDDGNGAYTLDPVNLFMPGLWEVTITVLDPGETEASEDDTTLDEVVFKFCVEG